MQEQKHIKINAFYFAGLLLVYTSSLVRFRFCICIYFLFSFILLSYF